MLDKKSLTFIFRTGKEILAFDNLCKYVYNYLFINKNIIFRHMHEKCMVVKSATKLYALDIHVG